MNSHDKMQAAIESLSEIDAFVLNGQQVAARDLVVTAWASGVLSMKESALTEEPTGEHALVVDHDGDRWVRSSETGCWVCAGVASAEEWADLWTMYGPLEVIFEGVPK